MYHSAQPNRTDCTLPFSRSLLVSLRLMCRSTLVSPLLMRMICHRVSPPRAMATELEGEDDNKTTSLVCTMLPTFIRCLNIRCFLPGKHPEEDDALVSGAVAEGVGRRRDLIVSLRGERVTLLSGRFTSCPLRPLWLRLKRPLTIRGTRRTRWILFLVKWVLKSFRLIGIGGDYLFSSWCTITFEIMSFRIG